MSGKILPSDLDNCPALENPLSLEIINDMGKIINLPAAVKTLTTAGAALNIQITDSVLKNQLQKGRKVLLRVNAGNGGGLLEVPGKILWMRSPEDDLSMTLGLELTESLPLSVRQTLEDYLPINAKDMKVLWDYWDEANNIDVPAAVSETCRPEIPEAIEVCRDTKEHIPRENNLTYWIGFSIILSGLGMQWPQLEYFSIFGLLIMFGGSVLIASKSIMEMRHRHP